MLTSKMRDFGQSRLKSDRPKRGIVATIGRAGVCNAPRLYGGCARRNIHRHHLPGYGNSANTKQKKIVSTKSTQYAAPAIPTAAAACIRPSHTFVGRLVVAGRSE